MAPTHQKLHIDRTARKAGPDISLLISGHNDLCGIPQSFRGCMGSLNPARAFLVFNLPALARGATGALPRVQMRAPTSPRTASSSASTATIGWTKNPGVLPSPPGPRPLRPAQRAKLISLVSCAHTTRRPAQARTVRMLDASMIVSTLKRGDDSRRCTATSPDRVPPMVLSTNDPVETIRSNSSTLRASTRGSPRPSSSIQKPQSSLRPLNQSYAKIETNFRASRSPMGEGADCR